MWRVENLSHFLNIHTQSDEALDGVFDQPWQARPGSSLGEAKRQRLTQELLAFKGLQ